jgi:rare lipoprotein A
MALRQGWIWIGLVLVSVGIMVTTGYGGTKPSPPQRGQIGWASWYGPGLQGGKTASGERFVPQQLTAAHRTLPFGTKVLVTNLQTQAQVEVKITDRGPRQKRRLIDLSYAAAKRLGILKQGLGRVQVVVSEPALPQPTPEDEILHVVQLRVFAQSGDAKALRTRLQRQYPRTYVVAHQGPIGKYYRVRMGPFHSTQQVQRVAQTLQQQGHEVFVDQVTRNAGQERGVYLPDDGGTPSSRDASG